jgi:arsenical pump membrane protein
VLHSALTLGIFGATLALLVVKPRGWNEAVWTTLGGASLLALRFVTPSESLAMVVTSRSAMLFLLALLLLSALIERSGFFAWAAIKAARLAKGDARALHRNVFLLGSAVTIEAGIWMTPLVLLAAGLALTATFYVRP